MSAFFPTVTRVLGGTHWLPGAMALVVLGLALVLLLQREVTRGALSPDREARVRATSVVVVPLLLCAGLVVGARFLELVVT